MDATVGSSHAFEEHTSEVEVNLRASSVEALFREAALALAEVMAGREVPASTEAREPVELDATDRDALLVDWLNELLFRTETSGRLYTAVRIDRLTDRTLSAAVGAVERPEPLICVKAATLHGVRIVETPGGWTANVVLDV